MPASVRTHGTNVFHLLQATQPGPQGLEKERDDNSDKEKALDEKPLDEEEIYWPHSDNDVPAVAPVAAPEVAPKLMPIPSHAVPTTPSIAPMSAIHK